MKNFKDMFLMIVKEADSHRPSGMISLRGEKVGTEDIADFAEKIKNDEGDIYLMMLAQSIKSYVSLRGNEKIGGHIYHYLMTEDTAAVFEKVAAGVEVVKNNKFDFGL